MPSSGLGNTPAYDINALSCTGPSLSADGIGGYLLAFQCGGQVYVISGSAVSGFSVELPITSNLPDPRVPYVTVAVGMGANQNWVALYTAPTAGTASVAYSTGTNHGVTPYPNSTPPLDLSRLNLPSQPLVATTAIPPHWHARRGAQDQSHATGFL